MLHIHHAHAWILRHSLCASCQAVASTRATSSASGAAESHSWHGTQVWWPERVGVAFPAVKMNILAWDLPIRDPKRPVFPAKAEISGGLSLPQPYTAFARRRAKPPASRGSSKYDSSYTGRWDHRTNIQAICHQFACMLDDLL